MVLFPDGVISLIAYEGALTTDDIETRQAIAVLKDKVDGRLATEVWELALETTWQASPVWVHGDISAGDLLVQDGKLIAVIDFGGMAIGDPACDLVIAWKFFEGKSREVFRSIFPLDAGTWAHGRGWALGFRKALIVAAGHGPTLLKQPNVGEPLMKCLKIIGTMDE